MFLVLLEYDAPLEEIDRLMDEHVSFLERCFEAGLFLAAGRRLPRTGGVILARAASRSELAEVMEHDPLVRTGAARYEVVEFRTSLHHPGLGPFADRGTRAVGGRPPGDG